MNSELKKNMKFVFSNSAIVFIFKIIGSGFGFIFQIMLGRFLGVEDYGLYTIFMTCINFICLFTVLGLDNSLIRLVPRLEIKYKKNLLNKSIVTSCIYFICVLILSIIFKGTLYKIVNISKIEFYIIMFTTVFIKSIGMLFDGYYQGEKKIIIVTGISSVVLNVCKMVLFIAVYNIYNNNIYTAMITYLFSELICLSIRLIIHIKEKKKMSRLGITHNIYTNNEYTKFLKYSISLSLITGTDILVHSIDKFMINSISGAYEVGLYRTAENYINLIAIFASTFVVFWPIISSLYKEKKIDMLNEIFGYIVKVLLFVSIPVIVFMIVYSKELLGIFGIEYISGNNILFILLIGVTVDTLSGPVGALLNMTNYAKYNLVNMIVMAILNTILNIILIPKLGAIGAAIATSISSVVVNIINIIQNKILLKVFPYDLKSILLLLSGGVIVFIDKILYNIISVKESLITMTITVLVNYIVYAIIFIIIVKPNIKKILVAIKKDESVLE